MKVEHAKSPARARSFHLDSSPMKIAHKYLDGDFQGPYNIKLPAPRFDIGHDSPKIPNQHTVFLQFVKFHLSSYHRFPSRNVFSHTSLYLQALSIPTSTYTSIRPENRTRSTMNQTQRSHLLWDSTPICQTMWGIFEPSEFDVGVLREMFNEMQTDADDFVTIKENFDIIDILDRRGDKESTVLYQIDIGSSKAMKVKRRISTIYLLKLPPQSTRTNKSSNPRQSQTN
ncbi:uncharacterized protein EAF01_010238 [Botrytis porri]|uniref:Uncharacterized protein n=1 Tax=Botrytis porri TaxID=87229 RepID=A0A4Z1KKA6_9HELO|nr:uncharacterized protein EAF01_010238 [Botrytis porri]KAF7892158.1 hypothetical protein EAF01_010238 [Botrytis porri]TGO83994.1 hypothetical protein BPOR_0565g00050 [Botrytis porri]